MIRVLAFSLLAATPAMADDLQLCTTNINEGILIAGQYGLVTAPVPYVNVTSIDTATFTFADIRLNGFTAVFPTDASQQLDFQFSDANNVPVWECAAAALPFDMLPLRPENIAMGNCTFNNEAAPPTVTAGETLTLRTQVNLIEVASAPGNVLNAVPQTADEIQITGIGEGIGTLIWLSRDEGNSKLTGLCPVIVTE